MPAARLVNSKGEVIIEQVDFTPAFGQVVVDPKSGVRYVVTLKGAEVHHVNPGAGMPWKWMNVVEVEPETAKKPGVVKG